MPGWLTKMGQDLEKKLEDDLSSPLRSHSLHTCVRPLVDPGLRYVVWRLRRSYSFDVWVSDGALQTLAVSHSSLLILISWEVEPVGGRYRDQLGGGEGGDPGHDFQVVALLPHHKQFSRFNSLKLQEKTYFLTSLTALV